MIDSLLIKNFQCHDKLKIDFGPITTIVGPSDCGKSAVIRALLWALTNSPTGEAFISHGADEVAVKVEIDGRSIVRKRGKPGNIYQLDGEEFKAFRNDVPAAIKDLINIDEVNIQSQHDSPFWVSLSDGEVSRRLNEVVDLSLVDSCLSVSKSQLVDAKKRREVHQVSIESGKQAIADLEWVKLAKAEADSCKKAAGEIDAKLHQRGLLGEALTLAESAQKAQQLAIDELDDLTLVGRKSADAVSLGEKAEALRRALSSYESLLIEDPAEVQLDYDTESLLRIADDLQSIKDAIAAYSRLELTPLEFGDDQALGEVESLLKDRESLSQLINSFPDSSEIEKTLAGTEELLLDFKSCPLCGAQQ